MPPKYHGVYNFIIIWSPTLGKGLMIWFDWTISKSNEWVTCILRSSNVHSKSFKIIQSVSLRNLPTWMIPLPIVTETRCFPVFFPWILPQHRDIHGFRCQVSTQTVWPKIVRPSTHLHTTSAGDAAISVAGIFPISRMTSESMGKSWEKHGEVVSSDILWQVLTKPFMHEYHKQQKMVGPWYRCRYPNFQPYPLHFAGSTS